MRRPHSRLAGLWLAAVLGLMAQRVAQADSNARQAWGVLRGMTAPLSGARIDADPQAYPGGAVAWEGWPNIRQTLLLRGGDPGADDPAREPSADLRFQTGAESAAVPARRVTGGRLVAFDPVFEASHLNETHLNRIALEYIRTQGLDRVGGQLAALSRNQPPDFPVGSVLMKAQWRPIDAARAGRYHTLSLALPGGGRRLYGLTAINLSFKRHAGPDGWLFAAFEHADFCTASRRGCTRPAAGAWPAAASWSNYRLRGTMDRPLDRVGRPVVLASSQLESGVTGSASCLTCHARASIGQVAGRVVRLSVLDLQARPEPGDVVRGFTGVPRQEWYFAAAPGRQRRYLPLDSVWSLAQAQPEDPR